MIPVIRNRIRFWKEAGRKPASTKKPEISKASRAEMRVARAALLRADRDQSETAGENTELPQPSPRE